MKARTFWISLFLIGISWVINSMYAQSRQLDDPIFLPHYIETNLQEHVHIPLYYLTNRNDSSSISYVTIDGIPNDIARNDFFDDFGFNHQPEHHQNLQTFTHHALRNIQLQLNTFELENLLQDGKFTFNEIEVFFNDGGNMTVPIGEITIRETLPDQKALESLGGSSSSDGDSKSIYRVTEDLSIENISLKFGDILQDHLLVKVDDKSLADIRNSLYTDFPQSWGDVPGIDIQNITLPYGLKKDETLYIYTQVLPGFIGYIESTVEFSGITETGESFIFSSWLMSQQPYLNQKDVNKMINK